MLLERRRRSKSALSNQSDLAFSNPHNITLFMTSRQAQRVRALSIARHVIRDARNASHIVCSACSDRYWPSGILPGQYFAHRVLNIVAIRTVCYLFIKPENALVLPICLERFMGGPLNGGGNARNGQKPLPE